MASKNVKGNVKKRNWTFILYPDSVPANWEDVLRATGLQCAISPLHEYDANADGEQKKPHWHVIACWSGPTSYNVVSVLSSSLGGTIPQPLEQVIGMYRYFTHKDNPEKFQYDEKDIRTLNGFNILDYQELSKSQVMKIKTDLLEMIKQENLYEYSDFVDKVTEFGTNEEIDVAMSNTLFFDRYLCSRRYKNEKKSGGLGAR